MNMGIHVPKQIFQVLIEIALVEVPEIGGVSCLTQAHLPVPPTRIYKLASTVISKGNAKNITRVLNSVSHFKNSVVFTKM